MTDRSTNTIIPSITSSNDNNVLILCRNVLSVPKFGIKQRLGVSAQKLHGKVDAFQVAVLDGKITCYGSTSCNDNSIILSFQIHEFNVVAHSDASLEDDALRSHEVGPSLNDLL